MEQVGPPPRKSEGNKEVFTLLHIFSFSVFALDFSLFYSTWQIMPKLNSSDSFVFVQGEVRLSLSSYSSIFPREIVYLPVLGQLLSLVQTNGPSRRYIYQERGIPGQQESSPSGYKADYVWSLSPGHWKDQIIRELGLSAHPPIPGKGKVRGWGVAN